MNGSRGEATDPLSALLMVIADPKAAQKRHEELQAEQAKITEEREALAAERKALDEHRLALEKTGKQQTILADGLDKREQAVAVSEGRINAKQIELTQREESLGLEQAAFKQAQDGFKAEGDTQRKALAHEAMRLSDLEKTLADRQQAVTDQERQLEERAAKLKADEDARAAAHDRLKSLLDEVKA